MSSRAPAVLRAVESRVTMLVNRTTFPRVTLVVVALGRTTRLAECLTSLIEHRSTTPFSIVCVVNPTGASDDGSRATNATEGDLALTELPIDVVESDVNLGWAGGLHAGRAALSSEFLVWVQDDMVVADGWLDALVAAADAYPTCGAFGSSQVDGDGTVSLFNAGVASPLDDIDRWNDTDVTASGLPASATYYDWVTSKGLLVRTSAWDAVGGPDPSLFPLNHVDKDFCSHLRVHGWTVMLVPDAHLRHRGNQSAPGAMREFLSEWQRPRLTRRWAEPLRQLAPGEAGVVEHECTRERASDVNHWVARESSLVVVAFGRWAEAARRRERDDMKRQADASIDAVHRTLSWRITAPLRAARHYLTPRRSTRMLGE